MTNFDDDDDDDDDDEVFFAYVNIKCIYTVTFYFISIGLVRISNNNNNNNNIV